MKNTNTKTELCGKNNLVKLTRFSFAFIFLAYGILSFFHSIALKELFIPLWGDFWYYTSIAQSIASEGTIKFANMYGVNTAYLYPALLSIIYKFFYNPYTISFLTRFVGVLVMNSTIFPSYLLCRKMGFSAKKTILLSISTVLIPDMMGCWLIQSEVLSYPLFMWTIYLFYLEYESDRRYWLTALIGIICFLNYLTRAQNLVIAFAYVLISLFWAWKERKNKPQMMTYLYRTFVFGITFFSLYYWVPRILEHYNILSYGTKMENSLYNGFSNSMHNQPLKFLLDVLHGNAYYCFYFLLAAGFFAIVIPFFYNGYNKMDKRFQYFVCGSFILTVELVVCSIFRIESHGETSRVHLRYLMYYFSPFFLLFYKVDFQNFKWELKYSIVAAIWFLLFFFGRYIYRLDYNTFLGFDGYSITVFRRAKNLITEVPSWEIWLEKISLLVVFAIAIIITIIKWKRFFSKVFPIIMLIFTMANYSLFIDTSLYTTRVGQGDYVSRYAPVADYLKDLNDGEAILLMKGMNGQDNEMQTLLTMLKDDIDCIGFDELYSMKQEYGNDVNIRDQTRTGFIYINSNTIRKLDRANYFVLFKNYASEYKISNEIAYEDSWFYVYKLDDGVLHFIE